MRPQRSMGNDEKCIHNATFYSPSELRSLPAPSSTNPQERKIVLDSEASMHMVSRKDLNSAELDTVRVSGNPATVITANGEVQTNEGATVCVHDFDLQGGWPALGPFRLSKLVVLSSPKTADSSRLEEFFEREILRGRSLSGNGSRIPCKDSFNGYSTNQSCNLWHPPECRHYKTQSGRK